MFCFAHLPLTFHSPPTLHQDPKPLPCSLPAPTTTSPAVKADADALTTGTPSAWAAVGGNERAKLADLASLSFEDWLSRGLPGANATACDSASVGSYAVNVTSACKSVAPGGGSYSIEFTARYGCTVSALKSSAASAKAPSPATAVKASALALDTPAPGDKVAVKAVLRAVVSQPPLRETAQGDLVRPKPSVDDVWLVSGSQATRALMEKKTVTTLAGAPASAADAAEEGAGEARVSATSGSFNAPGVEGGATAAVASIGAALSSVLNAAASMDGRMAQAAPAMMSGGGGGAMGGAMPSGGVMIISPASGAMMSSSGAGMPYFDDAHDMEGLDGDAADGDRSEASLSSSHGALSSASSSHPADTVFASTAPKTGTKKPVASTAHGGGARRLLAA